MGLRTFSAAKWSSCDVVRFLLLLSSACKRRKASPLALYKYQRALWPRRFVQCHLGYLFGASECHFCLFSPVHDGSSGPKTVACCLPLPRMHHTFPLVEPNWVIARKISMLSSFDTCDSARHERYRFRRAYFRISWLDFNVAIFFSFLACCIDCSACSCYCTHLPWRIRANLSLSSIAACNCIRIMRLKHMNCWIRLIFGPRELHLSRFFTCLTCAIFMRALTFSLSNRRFFPFLLLWMPSMCSYFPFQWNVLQDKVYWYEYMASRVLFGDQISYGCMVWSDGMLHQFSPPRSFLSIEIASIWMKHDCS